MSHSPKNQQADERNGKTCILIIGMHRSGTSALAGVLDLLGYEIGDQLIPALDSNPKGHFEKQSIVRLNDRIMAAMGTTWEDVFKLPVNNMANHHLTDEFKPRIKQILEDEFVFEKPVVIKDPRLCLVLPFWKESLDELGITSHVLIMNRHPYEVCKSLERRNNLSLKLSEGLWIYYTLAAEFHTRAMHRLIISHEEFMEDPVGQTKCIIDFLGHDPRYLDEKELQVSEFVNRQLVRSHFREEDDGFLSAESKKMFETLQYAAGNQASSQLTESFDRARESHIWMRQVVTSENMHRARISLLLKNGVVTKEVFEIREGMNTLVMNHGSADEIERVVFEPSNSDCVIELREIKLTSSSGEEKDAAKFATNASIRFGDKYLFNAKSPTIRIYSDLSLVDKISIKAYYEVLGDRSSKQFILRNLCSETGYKSYKAIIDFNRANEFRKNAKGKSMVLKRMKKLLFYLTGWIILNPLLLIRDIFRK